MTRKSTIRLLLINESDNEGERLISLFRNAGRVARAHRVRSAEDLHSNLSKHDWDLIIANDNHSEIDLESGLTQIKKLNPELPVIVVRDQDAQAALKAGASDAVASGDDQRLVFAALRELAHLEKHRELDAMQAKVKEAEQRCELLMAQSQEALAYVADGMLIDANPLFCTRFGYDNPDDLDCLPIIDLIADDDHNKIKSLLKAQVGNKDKNAASPHCEFTGIRQNDEPFSALMQLSNAVVDGEPCIQLSVRDEAAAAVSAANQAPQDTDPATGLYNHDYFLSQLRQTAERAAAGSETSTLLFIGIDNFTAFRSKWGITHAYSVVLDIAGFIQQLSSQASYLTHFCDDGFTLLLPATETDKALEFAQTLCHKLEEHIIEVDKQSIQCTASIGLVAVNKHSARDPNELVENAFSVCEQVRGNADNNGIGNGAAVFVPSRGLEAMSSSEGEEELDRTLEEALEDNRFTLIYQPVVSLRGTTGDHYEVRTVLFDEQEQQIPADQFLSSLSFSKPNTRIDRWTIIEATKQLSTNNSRHDTRLFINLTSNALLDDTLISWLSVALKAGGIKPQSLIFQFKESDVIDCLKAAIVFAKAVKELGCKISVTHFGQANDPYKTLKHVQADFAKICSGFDEQLQGSGDTQELKSMVSSINEQSTQAIISNIEHASALAVLWQLGVDYIQGNYLAAPTPEMDYEFTDIA